MRLSDLSTLNTRVFRRGRQLRFENPPSYSLRFSYCEHLSRFKMLNAFKIKDFDLQPIFEQWKDGPVFNGTKKDMPVEEWLEKIREGCVERGVPEEYWYKVAQHFMGPKARAR